MTPETRKSEPSPPKAAGASLVWRVLRIFAGWTLLLLGILGLFLPVLQGFLFIASGLALLSADVQWARRLREKLSKWRRGPVQTGTTGGPTPPKSSGSPPNTPI